MKMIGMGVWHVISFRLRSMENRFLMLVMSDENW
jgi:hypothetical protein